MSSSVASLVLAADISQLTAALGKIPGITAEKAQGMVIALEKGFQKAERASKAMAEEVRKNSAASAREAQRAIEQSATAMENAQRRLQDLSVAADPMERLNLTFQRQKEEIAALAFQTGDQAMAMKATAAATANYHAEVAKLSSATQGASAGLGLTAQRAAAAGLSVGDLSFRSKVLRAQLADIGTTLAGGMNPFVVFAQQGPDVVQALGGTNSAGAVLKETFGGLLTTAAKLGPALAAIGIAVSAAAAVYGTASNAAEEAAESNGRFAQRLEDAEKAADKAKDKLIALSAAIASLRTGTDDALLTFEVLNGQVTEAEAAYRRETAAIEERTSAALLTSNQLLAEAQSRVELNKEILASSTATEEQRQAAEKALSTSRQEVQSIRAQVSETERLKETQLLIAEATKLKTEADEAAADASDRSAQGAQRNRALLEDQEKAMRAQAEALQSLASIRQSASDDQLDAMGRLRQSMAEELAKIQEIENANANSPIVLEQAEKAKTAVYDRAARERAAILLADEKEYQDAKAAMIEAATQQQIAMERQIREERQKTFTDGLGAMGTFAGGMSDLLAMAAEENAKTNRKLAMQQFRASKAAGVAEATVNGAVAITMALRQLGPVAGALAAAGIGASTAAQIAVISSQKPAFDRGGLIQGGMMADQVPIRAMQGEAVLNRGAVRQLGGEQGVNAINRGQSSPMRATAFVPTYRHFGRFIRDELQRASVLSQAITARSAVGSL